MPYVVMVKDKQSSADTHYWACFTGPEADCKALSVAPPDEIGYRKVDYRKRLVESNTLSSNGVPRPAEVALLEPVGLSGWLKHLKNITFKLSPTRSSRAVLPRSVGGAALVAVAITLCGCTTFGRGPAIEKRFSSLAGDKDLTEQEGLIELSVSTAPGSKAEAAIAITALAERAQAALIAKSEGAPPTLIRSAAPPRERATVQPPISRQVTIGLRPVERLTPGDRLDVARLTLRVSDLSNADWQITSWSQATNDLKTIEIGKETDTITSKFTAGSSVTIGPFLPDAKVSAEQGRTTGREYSVRDETLFNAGVDNGTAWLDQFYGWRDNGLRSSAITVTLTPVAGTLGEGTTTHTFTALTSKPAKASDPAAALPAKQVALLPHRIDLPSLNRAQKPICGVATLTYSVRHITNDAARATITEGDDAVQRLIGRRTTHFVFSPPPYVETYVIKSGERYLTFRPRSVTGAGVVRFESRADAEAFIDWLKEVRPAHGELMNGSLQIDQRELAGPDIGSLASDVRWPNITRTIAALPHEVCQPPSSPADLSQPGAPTPPAAARRR